MQADIKEFLTGRGIEWEEVDDLAKVAGDVDVLYQTRIQKERFQVNSSSLPPLGRHQSALVRQPCCMSRPWVYAGQGQLPTSGRDRSVRDACNCEHAKMCALGDVAYLPLPWCSKGACFGLCRTDQTNMSRRGASTS